MTPWRLVLRRALGRRLHGPARQARHAESRRQSRV
jgi:hypothetical protein